MIYSKSQAAFVLSCQKLFDEHPRVFFWTFTFRQVNADWVCMNMWNQFYRQLVDNHAGYCPGVRVVELHKTHGMHFHALIALRISIHIVRRISKRYGFGIVHVKRADKGAINYLVPYLQKERELLKGQRSWAAIGGFKGVKCRNIEVDSQFHRNMKELTAGKRVHYLYARDVYRNTMLWGETSNWQKSRQEPKRVYFLNPNKMFIPRKVDGVDSDWHSSYPRTLFSRNVKKSGSGA